MNLHGMTADITTKSAEDILLLTTTDQTLDAKVR